MTNIREELSRTFDLATLRHEASNRLNGDDWNQYQKIKESHQQARKDVSKRFKADNAELIGKAKKRILEEEGKRDFTFKPIWAGDDKPDKDKLHRKAVAKVKGWEQAEHRHIDKLETQQLQGLMDSAQGREQHRQDVIKDFTQAVDRRSRRDRRQR